MLIPRDERGVALIVSLLITLVVAMIGVAVAVSARGGERVATAFGNQQRSFEAAVAGLEDAREQLRLARYNSALTVANYSSLLTTAANGGTLVNSASLSNFGATTGFSNATSNTPFLASTALDSAAYQVFLTNAARNGESVTSTTDSDDVVTLTSFGSGPNSVGFSAVQGVYSVDPNVTPPLLPGLLTMPGPDVTIDLPNGNASSMDGDDGSSPPKCYATIAVSTTTARNTVQAAMSRPNNYSTCSPGGTGMASVDNFISGANPYHDPATNTPVLQTGSTSLTSVSYLNDLVAEITAVADYVGTDTGSINLGTWNGSTCTSPKTVVITGNFNMGGNTNGCGILVVTGTLTMNGTPGYHGGMYVIGTGAVVRKGGGNGVINCGGMLIANTTSPARFPGLVGKASYTINGGGNSSFEASCGGGMTGELLNFSKPLKRTSFQQIR